MDWKDNLKIISKEIDNGYFSFKSLKELLEDFFLKAFKSEEQFCFYSDTYLVNNPVYSSVSEIFEDQQKFVWESEKLAKHLYDLPKHNSLQK